MRAVTAHLRAWLAERGSTRGPAAIRIGLAFLLWLTWGDDFTFFHARGAEALVVAAFFYGATGAMLLGLYARLSTAFAAAVSAYIYYKLGVVDGSERFVHHHTALLVLATMICALTPCGRSLSVDRWRLARRGPTPAEEGPIWAMRLWQLLVAVVYLGGAASKSNAGWLSGERLEQIFTFYYGDSSYSPASLASLFAVATIGVVALEYALAFGLWSRRARRLLVPAGVVLHVSFYLLLPVETFSLTMLLLYTAFEPTLWDRRPAPGGEPTRASRGKRLARARARARARAPHDSSQGRPWSGEPGGAGF